MLRCSFSIRKMGKTHRELFSGLKLENGYYYFGKYKNAIRSIISHVTDYDWQPNF